MYILFIFMKMQTEYTSINTILKVIWLRKKFRHLR